MIRPLPFVLAFALGLAACQPAETSTGPEASEAPGEVEPSSASSSATPASTDSVLISPVTPGATATSGPGSENADMPKSKDTCGADEVSERWLNALPTADVKSAIAKAVGERPIRYYGEGDAITMDFSAQRLNVELGKDGRIKLFRCG